MRFRKIWEGCKDFPARAVVGGWAGARTEPQRVFGWMPGSQDMRLTCLNRIRKVSFRLIFGGFRKSLRGASKALEDSAGIRSAT